VLGRLEVVVPLARVPVAPTAADGAVGVTAAGARSSPRPQRGGNRVGPPPGFYDVKRVIAGPERDFELDGLRDAWLG
jgi:hypothetical protein